MWQPGLWGLRVNCPASPRSGGHKPPSCRPWRQNVGFLCCFWPLSKSILFAPHFQLLHSYSAKVAFGGVFFILASFWLCFGSLLFSV